MANNSWFLVRYRPNQEKRAIENLKRQNIESFSPWLNVKKKVNGRVYRQSELMFPGYLFIRSDEDINWMAVTATRGIINTIRFGADPVAISQNTIDAVKAMIPAVESTHEGKISFLPGSRVEVKGGAFSGMEAICKSKCGEERSIVLIKMLQGHIELNIENKYLHAE